MNDIDLDEIVALAKSGTPAEVLRRVCEHARVPIGADTEAACAADERDASVYAAELRRTPPDGVKAYFGGIYEIEFGATGAAVCYLAGTERYSKSDPDWTVQPAWLPDARLRMSALETLTEGVLGSEPWLEAVGLGYGAALFRVVTAELGAAFLLGKRPKVHLAVGWDSGDVYEVGVLKA